MYNDLYSIELTKKLTKIKKKNIKHYQIIQNKINWIIEHPKHKYKILHHTMKGIRRIHIGQFVLIFRIDHNTKIISFENYDHHDKIYR